MSSEEFKIGDPVMVRGFSDAGTIVSIDGAQARVQLQGPIIKVAVSTLTRVSETQKTTKKTDSRRKIVLTSQAVDAGHRALFSLDLHGRTTADAIDLLEQQVSRAVMAGMHEIEIVHGVGTGRVKEAIHKRLSELSAVARYEIKYSNRGVTRVFLRG